MPPFKQSQNIHLKHFVNIPFLYFQKKMVIQNQQHGKTFKNVLIKHNKFINRLLGNTFGLMQGDSKYFTGLMGTVPSIVHSCLSW